MIVMPVTLIYYIMGAHRGSLWIRTAIMRRVFYVGKFMTGPCLICGSMQIKRHAKYTVYRLCFKRNFIGFKAVDRGLLCKYNPDEITGDQFPIPKSLGSFFSFIFVSQI